MQEIKGVYLEFDGIPFIILGHKLLECQNGPEKKRALQERQSTNKRVKWIYVFFYNVYLYRRVNYNKPLVRRS